MGKNYVISRILEPRGVRIASIIVLKVFAVLSLSYIALSIAALTFPSVLLLI